jgi:hypothetical protein
MGLRAFCEHVTAHTGETIRIELDSAGYSGSPLELIGTGRNPLWFSHEYEQLNKANVYDTIIQKSYAEFNYYNRGSAEQTLLDEILSATEGTFKLTKKINGTVDWVGVVLGDLSGFNDGEAAPFPIKIVAKDFTNLVATNFPLENEVQTVAKVVSRIVANMGYNLPIHTRTSWITSGTTAANDFMRQVYVQTRNLRDFGDPDPVQITNEEALNRLLSPYKCIIKITNGVFLIDQLSAYLTPTSVLTTVYDTNGDFVSQSNVNTVKSANTNIKVVTGSVNEIKPAYKRVRATYNHRTPVSDIKFPSFIALTTAIPADVSQTQFFQANGDSFITLTGQAFVLYDQPILNTDLTIEPIAQIQVRSGSLYWNDAQQIWQSSALFNEFAMQDADTKVPLADKEGNFFRQSFTTSINIVTKPVPIIDSGAITITLRKSPSNFASTTSYNNLQLILSGQAERDSGESNGYELVQAGQYSNDFNSGAFWFGDGPTDYSPSALLTSTNTSDLTTTWQRRGTTPNRPMHENLLAEIMDSHRSYARMLDAILRDGTFAPYNTLSYETLSFYFIGGSFDAYTGEWQITAIQNAFATSNTDILNVGVLSGPSLITSGLFTAARLASNNAIESSGGFSFRTTVNLSGTVSQIFVQSVGTTTPQLTKDAAIRLVHPITLQSYDFIVAQDMTGGSNVIPVVPVAVSGVIPVGSWVFTNTADASTAILIARNAIQAVSRSSAVGELATASTGPVTSIDVNLFVKVREGDDLFLISALDGVKRSFTVGQTAGPGLVTLQVDQVTVFDSPIGSYILGSSAQVEGLLQVTPAGVLAKAEAITTQNAFAILSAPLSTGSVSSISVTSVRAIKLNAGTAIGLQDRAGNTVFFTIDVTQTLTVASTIITVTTEIISTAIGAGASVFQPMWNQSAQLSVQADQIALRVTETQVQTIINENIGGLIPAVNFTFQNTDEGFTTSDVTLTTTATYVEYLATDVNPFIEKSGLSIVSADNPTVTIRVVRIAGTNWNGAFGWSTDGTNFFSQSFAEPSNVDNDFSFATINLTGNANYTGTITHIRLFLGNANLDEFYINQISVGKFDPNAEIIEDLSTRLTAAESSITVESDRIDLFTQKSNELNRIAEVTGTYSQSSTFTSITLTNTRSGFTVRNGQALFLVNVDGTFQSVTVDGNQTLSTSVTINSQVFATTIIAGAMLYESSFTSSSRITAQAGTIVLKAEQVSGGTTPISKLALVRLDATAASGSSILLQANQITLDGQTTFLNSLAVNRFTQVASNNVVIESGTAPATRTDASGLQIGDVWIDTANSRRPSVWNGAIWGRGFTVINGGTITTGTINANNVAIQNTSGSSPDVKINGTGITILQNDGTNETSIARSVHWINSTNTTNQARLVSYAGMATRNVAIDAAGFANDRAFRFSVRRNIAGVQDLSIGIAGDTDDFVTGSAQGDAVVSVSNGILWLNDTVRVTSSLTANSLIVGTSTNKATISYTTNTSRTFTIPDTGANANFVMTAGTQTIAGLKTFSSNLTVSGQQLELTNASPIIFGASGISIRTGGFSERIKIGSGTGEISFFGLPTSSSGLASGRIWNDSGTLKIIP